MPATYEPIATHTIASPQADYTFSSIPGTYTDLVCVIAGTIAATADNSLFWRANGDTATNYSATRISGNGTAAASFRQSNETAALTGFIGTTSQSIQIINFMNYANTTTYKTSVSRGSYSAQNVGAFVSLYRSTSAITSLTFFTPSQNLNTGMTLTLYGILSA
jgi:hypothetical protein